MTPPMGGLREREDPDEDEPGVRDRGVGEQALDVGLGDRAPAPTTIVSDGDRRPTPISQSQRFAPTPT